jgi:prepilin-type N-terminal cleavage/methylation domain-containing protein
MNRSLININKAISRGFTLIELLIVIAIIGILTAATLAVLDPIDKINAGNDSKVEQDIAQIGKGAEAYAISHNGTYPVAIADMVTSGDLRNAPTAPGGYSAYTWSGGGAAVFTISGQLKSKKFVNATPSTPFFKYTSATGKACAAAAVAGNC